MFNFRSPLGGRYNTPTVIGLFDQVISTKKATRVVRLGELLTTLDLATFVDRGSTCQ